MRRFNNNFEFNRNNFNKSNNFEFKRNRLDSNLNTSNKYFPNHFSKTPQFLIGGIIVCLFFVIIIVFNHFFFRNSKNDDFFRGGMMNITYTTNCRGVSVCCKNKQLCDGDDTNNKFCTDSCKKAYSNNKIRFSGTACSCANIPNIKQKHEINNQVKQFDMQNISFDIYKTKCGDKIICCKDGVPCHRDAGYRCNSKCANAQRVKRLRVPGDNCEC